MAKAKSHAQIDREINAALEASGHGRYMLVDNTTGKDMRLAEPFEVADIQRNRYGIGHLKLGGGYGTKEKTFEVRLRDAKGPKKPSKNPTLSEGTTIKSRSFRIGEFEGGRLYLWTQYGEFSTLDKALKHAKALGWKRRRGGVIVEDQQLVRQGGVYGSKQVLHSMIDGKILYP
jgi:hypothetical protein